MTLDESLARRLEALSPAQRSLFDQILADSGADLGIRRRPPGNEAPTSYEQERLWFMNQLVAHPEIFHVPTAMWLRGAVDVPGLKRALQALIRRHEALRTVFRGTGDDLRQLVLDELEVPLQVEDCTAEDCPTAKAVTRASESVQERFNLTHGPLLRAHLYQTGGNEYLLVLVQHHIVSDYWSLGILLSDLGVLYTAEIGAGPEPRELDLHYPDFAYWQRATKNRRKLQDQLQFWRQQLEGAPESLDLPFDRTRPVVRGSQGKFHRVRFGPELTVPLRELAREHSTTLLAAYLASYVGLLSRMTRHESIVVGVPIAGRPRPELQGMIGYFLNWLPIRVHVADCPSLSELVARTATALTQAMAHQDVPFDMLVQECGATRRPGSTPIFQTSFSLRDSAPQTPHLPGIEVEFADLQGGATHFDLMAELWCEGDDVVGYLPYDDELFDETTVAAWARRLHRLIALGTEAPDTPIATLSLFREDEQVRLTGSLFSIAEITAPVDITRGITSTLHGRFVEHATHRPDAPALTDETTKLTYAELDERSNRVANALLSKGVRHGEVVGLVGDRTNDLVTGLLGILKTGAAYLPIDPDIPAERIALQFDACAVRAVLVSPERIESLPPNCPNPLPLNWSDPDFTDATPVLVQVPDSSPAYVIYTSGSTGVPKGVLVSHANVVRLFDATAPHVDIRQDDVWTLFHSIAFDFSVWEIWGALAHGGHLIVVPQWITRAPDVFAELLAREGVTMLSQTPSAFGQLAGFVLKKSSLTQRLCLRHIVFGGETLAHSSLRDWFKTFGDDRPVLTNMYGITETTVHVTARRVREADLETGESLIGCPLADLSLYLLDDNLQPVPPGVSGEIFVGGYGVTNGYVADPALTAQRMIPDPWSPTPGARMYRSGDIAVMRIDGELAYLGRFDHQHKIRGHRVELGEVQAALDNLEEVAQSAVVAAEDQFGVKRLVAYVVLREVAPSSGTQIRRALLRILPDWMVPTSVHVVRELPLTRNGKLDQRALAASSPEAREPGTALSGDVATTLAEIWSDLLGMSNINAEDHFFELGGHSLMVVQLISRIERSFGVEMPMAMLFEVPRLQQMADAIEDLLAAARGVREDNGSTVAPQAQEDLVRIRTKVHQRLQSIHRPSKPRPTPATPEKILLTGASGFVGAFTLATALADGHHVVCLLRGGDARRHDLLTRLDRLGLRGPQDDTQLSIVDGDLALPRLGLNDAQFSALVASVTRIINVGARVNHVYPYDQLAAENTHSLATLLEIAAMAPHRTTLVHVSTSSVVDNPDSTSSARVPAGPLHRLPSADNGYVLSKALSEEYVALAKQFDVAGAVVRIGSVFGDLTRFQVNDADAVWNWARAMLETGSYPASFDDPANELFQALPADVAARILLHVAVTNGQPGCTWVNAVPDAVCSTVDLITAVRTLLPNLRAEPDVDWYARVARLDPGRIWVAGIAAGAARRAANSPYLAPRTLHRFDPGSDPTVARLLADHPVGTEEISAYLRSLVAADT
jgi:amino acid adenylation domain